MSDPQTQVHRGQLTPVTDTTPQVINAKCPTPDQVSVTFKAGVDRSDITDYALQVLREICSRACVWSVVISSGVRSAEAQVDSMYKNLDHHGVLAERGLYGSGGNKVIDEYVAGKADRLSESEIKARMIQMVHQHADELHHVQRRPGLSVFDVSPSSVQESAKMRLYREIRDDPRVERSFFPPKDRGIHFEIPSP